MGSVLAGALLLAVGLAAIVPSAAEDQLVPDFQFRDPGLERLEDGLLRISASVQNWAAINAEGVAVDWYIDGRLFDREVSGSVPGGDTASVASRPWKAGPGPHEIRLVVDPDNTVREQREDNNERWLFLDLGTSDSAPPSLRIEPQPYQYIKSEADPRMVWAGWLGFTLQAVDPDPGEVLETTLAIDGRDFQRWIGTGSHHLDLDVCNLGDGAHEFTLRVSDGSHASWSNFQAIVACAAAAPAQPVASPPPLPDLRAVEVRAGEHLLAGLPGRAMAVVENTGDVELWGYSAAWFLDGTLVTTTEHSGVAAHGRTVAESAVLPSRWGEQDLRVVLDHRGSIAESSKENNAARITIVAAPTAAMPPATPSPSPEPSHSAVSMVALGLDLPQPRAGHAVTLFARVENHGPAPYAGNLHLSIIHGQGEEAPQPAQFVQLAAGGTEVVEVPWTPFADGTYHLWARLSHEADPRTLEHVAADADARWEVDVDAAPVPGKPVLVLSAGLLNIGTIEQGTERTVPVEITAYNAKATGVTIEVLEAPGLQVTPLTPPVDIEAGQTIRFYVRLKVGTLEQDEALGAQRLLLQASSADGAEASNVESVDVVLHAQGFHGAPGFGADLALAALAAGGAAAFFRRRVGGG